MCTPYIPQSARRIVSLTVGLWDHVRRPEGVLREQKAHAQNPATHGTHHVHLPKGTCQMPSIAGSIFMVCFARSANLARLLPRASSPTTTRCEVANYVSGINNLVTASNSGSASCRSTAQKRSADNTPQCGCQPLRTFC